MTTRGPAVLSVDAIRPLTSRELSTILCSILRAVATIEPEEIDAFATLLDTVGPAVAAENHRTDRNEHVCLPSWRIAFAATVSGFYTWCDPQEIETAVEWISQNLPHLFRQTRALD